MKKKKSKKQRGCRRKNKIKAKGGERGSVGCYGEDEDGWEIQTGEGGAALFWPVAGEEKKIKKGSVGGGRLCWDF